MMKKLFIAVCLLSSFTAFSQEETPVAASTTSERPPKTELQMGDLPANAFTTYQGTFIVHPFLPSSYAVTDNLEVKSGLLGLFGGPNATVEYALIKNSDMALSVEPAFAANWGFNGYTLGGTVRFSQRAGNGFFNANAGGTFGVVAPISVTVNGQTTTTPATSAYSIPVTVGYSLVSSPHTIWDFRLGSNVASFLSGTPGGSAGFTWYHSFGGTFQLGLGLNVIGGQLPAEVVSALKTVGINLPFFILPVPDVMLGWKF